MDTKFLSLGAKQGFQLHPVMMVNKELAGTALDVPFRPASTSSAKARRKAAVFRSRRFAANENRVRALHPPLLCEGRSRTTRLDEHGLVSGANCRHGASCEECIYTRHNQSSGRERAA